MSSLVIKKVLIIDDSAVVREGIKRTLAPSGFSIFAAQNWAEANKIFFHDKPDLILIDVNLGTSVRGDRIVELYRLKSGPAYRPMLVLYSDMDKPALVALAETCGADGAIAKTEDIHERVTWLLRDQVPKSAG